MFLEVLTNDHFLVKKYALGNVVGIDIYFATAVRLHGLP